MAISDKLATFADGTALNTGGAGNYVIGDQIDLQVTEAALGAMTGLAALYVVIAVDAAATSGGSATASFSIITSDAADMSSPTVLATTAVIPLASLTSGFMVGVLAIPPSVGMKRYLGLRQTTGTAAFTGGSVNAYITPTPPFRHAYPQDDAISY